MKKVRFSDNNDYIIFNKYDNVNKIKYNKYNKYIKYFRYCIIIIFVLLISYKLVNTFLSDK